MNSDARLNVCTNKLAMTTAPGQNMLGEAERSITRATAPSVGAATARPSVGVAPARPSVGTAAAMEKEGVVAAGLPSSPSDPLAA